MATNLSDDTIHEAMLDLKEYENDLTEARINFECETNEEKKRVNKEVLEEARRIRDEQKAYVKTFPYIVVREAFDVTFAVHVEVADQGIKIHEELLQARREIDSIEHELRFWGLL